MVAAAGAQRARPAGMAIVLRVNVAALQKVGLLFAVDARRNVSQTLGVPILDVAGLQALLASPSPTLPEVPPQD